MGQPNLAAAVHAIAFIPEYRDAFRRVFGREPNAPICRVRSQPNVVSFTDNDFHNIGIDILRHDVVPLAQRRRGIARVRRPQRDTARAFGPTPARAEK